MSDIAIQVNNLTKIYPIFEKKADRLIEALSLTRKKYHSDFYALNNISFEIKKGETIGIIGQNGSGKSTLLKILSGVLTQTSGNVTIKGKISALLELGAGFNPEMTGMENIFLTGTIMGYSKEEMMLKVETISKFADIGDFLFQPVKTYSSGMFTRLAFAVAINVEPEILIVDEVLSVGDLRFQIKCMNQMKQMMSGGATVLFVSHDINAVRRFCSKAIWINNGHIVKSGDVNSVADQYLNYLKLGEIEDASDKDKADEQEIETLAPFNPNINQIAEIIDFKILDRKGSSPSEVGMDEYVKIQVIYDVYDESVKNPVLGIALFGIDDEYICGLNTLLDRIPIPWVYGRNRFQLEYPFGLRALGGNYYFDVALFEETATVAIQYKKMIKEITISSGYKGEGKYVIPHIWGGGDTL
ncbi:MAG: transporter related protein [Neobacillus sp.]|jgi:lipopolysaccharide transport system ATP-binding protein/teichoic acid transport system ATP-binding protein|nr:transporter related protein [Neobacillus sp.]